MPLLENVTMTDFEEGRKSLRTVILPCGSVEEHGSHLPLGTDTFHAVALAREVAERIPVWVAPPVFYGLCRSGSEHPGTISVRAKSLQALIQDIIRGLYSQGMRQVIVLSGHAGGTHMAALLNAAEELLAELPCLKIAVLSVLDLGETAWEGIIETADDAHAGEMETSLMLYLNPQLVHGRAPTEHPTFPRHILVRNKRSFWPGGVSGNPKAASLEKGKALMSRSVDALTALIHQLENWTEPQQS